MGDDGFVQRDGKVAFSKGAGRIAETRKSATKGRVHKILGTDGTFSEQFKRLILTDDNQILEREHLVAELTAVKRILKVLKPDQYAEDKLLYNRLRDGPFDNSDPNPLCIFWKHGHNLSQISTLSSRYVFPSVIEECHMLTAIFDFAPNLFHLEDIYQEARRAIDDTVRMMNKKRRGVVIVGTLEPDLRSHKEIMTGKELSKLCKQKNWDVPESGGWVLSGHFFVRAPYIEEFGFLVRERLGAHLSGRVEIKDIKRDRNVFHHVLKVLNYASKFPEKLFNTPTRGQGKKQADQMINEFERAFGNGFFDTLGHISADFSIDEAIRQWALFINRLGSKTVHYSVESVHAQKWLSETEMNYLISNDLHTLGDGSHLIEILRDTGDLRVSRKQERMKGKGRRLQTRPLKYDAEWVHLTDIGKPRVTGEAVSFDDWYLS